MNGLLAYSQFQSFEKSGCIADGIPTLKCIEVVFSNILFLSSMLVILVLFVMIVVGAFQYLTSRGNADAMKKARNTITYSFIGLGLFLSSYLILNVIQFLFIGDPEKDGVPSLLKFELPNFEPSSSSSAPSDSATPAPGRTASPRTGGGTVAPPSGGSGPFAPSKP